MLGEFVLSLAFTLVLLCKPGIGIRINAALPHDVCDRHHDDLVQHVLKPKDDPIRVMAEAMPVIGSPLPKPTTEQAKWIAKCDSGTDQECAQAIDGDYRTSWQSSPGVKGVNHHITIDLRAVRNLNALRVAPPVNWQSGSVVAGHQVFLSEDGKKWGDPVAYGTWFEDNTAKWAIFEPRKAKFVRLLATSANEDKQSIGIAELDIWAVTSLPDPTGEGKWGPTIDFPLVPVGAFIDPVSGNVVSFSSDSHDGNGCGGKPDTTWTAIWDRTNKSVSQKLIEDTKHNMFCPGMAFDVNGSMIITGGATASKTSTFNAANKSWNTLREMNIPRGYQGSTTCADGSIFVIGGSWSPDSSTGGRFGELYDPSLNKWQRLDECRSGLIETKTDTHRAYRADNHVWLFGWKEKMIFHAGPAAEMHWINTARKGAMTAAGIREVNAAMCGNAVMYDAAAGKILTAGGAPQYEVNYRNDYDGRDDRNPASKSASSNASIITLSNVNANVSVASAGGGMHFPRTFSSAVILPNGDTFVAGGQEVGQPFTDDTAEFRPEIYSPKTDKWQVMAKNSIPRTYHSFGLLLRDATVLVGGGGLSSLPTNHLNAQIFTPPYLLTSHARPVIKKLFTNKVHLGATLTFVADNAVADASLIRYGGATHTVNNDQRRIKLTPATSGNVQFQYNVQIPADAGIAIPGYWMLFVMNDAGVPSEASTVLILCTDCKVMQSKAVS
ncbi:MAG: hypothetical protein M1821_000779 [Bathelium mastoideum]|nr:MAG: hypothetical protein M1821_000779 [Bathelium mastoideum]